MNDIIATLKMSAASHKHVITTKIKKKLWNYIGKANQIAWETSFKEVE